jgi:hypothetical protein
MQDLWNVDLSKADVIAVYGLHPIMGKLGKKMEKELKPGSIVGKILFQWSTSACRSACSSLIYIIIAMVFFAVIIFHSCISIRISHASDLF